VAVISDPADYDAIADELEARGGALSDATKKRLAVKAFQRTADYDRAIASYLCAKIEGDDDALPAALTLAYERAETMRYGENPHQRAALYRRVGGEPAGWFKATVHQGKTVSYNNLVDLEAAVALSAELVKPACVVVKHTNPCGAASDCVSLDEAWDMALETDPQSAFGGIVALNGQVDGALAAKLAEIFLEVVVARGFSDEALAVLSKKKNLRVVTWRDWGALPPFVFRQVGGGLLVQTPDASGEQVRAARVVTKRAPTEEEWKRLTFAWTVCKHVKSNAIVLADGRGLLGVGAGQMSRVDSVELALSKARRPVAGAVLASDAFFPFKDSVERAAAAGITALVQPGGSIRDEESVAAADERGMAMVFTDVRHFRHL
jgi:phosphoribosylaminoimidazolecarboxamide formyltransferase/IMP cyclohydrolase